MLCNIKKKSKVCRGSRGVTTFILNPSTTSLPGCFIPGKRAHSTHKIGGGMGQEASHRLFIPYPSTILTTNALWGSKEMKWAEHRLGFMSCNWSLYCNSHVLVFLLLYAFIVYPEHGGSSFHWNIGSCVPKYVVSLLKISQCLGDFPPPPKYIWCCAEPFTDYSSSELHICSSYLAVNTFCLGYRNKSVNALWESKN